MEDSIMNEVINKYIIIEQKVEDTNNNVMRLVEAVKGNSITGRGGMIADIDQTRVDVQDIKKRLTDVEMNQKKWMFAMTVIMSILGMVATVAGVLIAIFKK